MSEIERFGPVDKRLLRPFEEALRSSVEPVVVRAGFEWNESGLHKSGTELTALFEADQAEFMKRFPELWQRLGVDSEAGCVDLWIRYYLSPRTISAELERDVGEWMRNSGHEDLADELSQPSDVDEAATVLAKALGLMLFPGSEQA